MPKAALKKVAGLFIPGPLVNFALAQPQKKRERGTVTVYVLLFLKSVWYHLILKICKDARFHSRAEDTTLLYNGAWVLVFPKF